MAKIAVFDSGWEGDNCADFISSELGIFQVDRIIDWKNFPYSYRKSTKIRELTKNALKPYIGRYEVIVLGSNIVTLHALEYLQKKFPKQKIEVSFT